MAGKATKDIALAAWISMHYAECRIKLVKVVRNGKDSEFVFSDPNDEWDRISAPFPNSEAQRFDASMRALKSLGYTKNRTAR